MNDGQAKRPMTRVSFARDEEPKDESSELAMDVSGVFRSLVLGGGTTSSSSTVFIPQQSASSSSTSIAAAAADNSMQRPALSDRTPVEVSRAYLSENTGSATVKTSAIRTRDIVKIFTSDNDYIEVSPEQLARVKMMHGRMEEGATLSFNYNTLLLVASILAGLGLVSNSTATIIASMLVSPIMGPVVGLAYGSTIRDWRLVRKSLAVETISLIVCIVMGMTIGAITGPTPLSDDWPTSVNTRKNESSKEPGNDPTNRAQLFFP